MPGLRLKNQSRSRTPADFLSGIVLWIDPSFVRVTLASGKVSAFTNRGSLGGTVAQAMGANQVAWNVHDANFRGRASVSSVQASLYPLPDLSALTSGEIFAVLKKAADPSTGGAGGSGGIHQIGLVAAGSTHVPFTDGVIYDASGSTVRKTAGNPTPSLASPFLYDVWSATTDWSLRLNRASFFTTAVNTVSFPAAGTLFQSSAAGPIGMVGELVSYIVCSAKQSTDSRGQWEAWVRREFGC